MPAEPIMEAAAPASVLSDAAPTPQAVVQPICDEGPWEAWFAWHPVRLYMTGHIRWLCTMHRRRVVRHGLTTHEYTVDPANYPGQAEQAPQ